MLRSNINFSDLNAGEIVEHAIRRQNVSISELSRQMSVTRRTLYNWFAQKKLSPDVIFTIGEFINYDFTVDFKEEYYVSHLLNSSKSMIISEKNDKENPTSDSVYWMGKYIALLEEYKRLLQEGKLY